MQTMTARTTAVLATMALAATGLAIEHADAHGNGDGPPGRSVAQDARAERNVVDVTVTDHSIDLPEEIPAGWTTFRFHNRSEEVHFGVLELLPENRTVQDSIDEVVPVFQDAMDLIDAGDPAAGFAEFANLPDWYDDVVFTGGPGLVAPGETAVVTVDLEPGTYAMECYVKTDGVFHSTHGMIAGLTVTEEESVRTEPTADVTVTVSGVDGLTVDGEFRPGRQTIAVHFADQAVHLNGLGHDLHIARIDDDTDLGALGTWMNWISGLDGTPPVHFLGGTHEMPAGSTAYVDVTLRPGSYVLVSEVDDPASKGLLHTLTIP